MVHAGAIQFKLDFSLTNELQAGTSVASEPISVGGRLWQIRCYPRGDGDGQGQYISFYLDLISDSKDVKTIFHVFNVGRDGEPTFCHERRLVHVFSSEKCPTWGWAQFMNKCILESHYVANGWATFVCNVMVLGADPIPVPPSDIGLDLGGLLDCAVGTDVSFIVKGEAIPAHRVVLAARSPVFKAELFGSTADATSPSITLKEIEPATFRAMLEYMYTDELPDEDYNEHGDSPTELMQDLLAAADRYGMDRLKLMCAQKLWVTISADTFASTLVCAETYNCPELKSKCIDFFAVDENFKKIVFTEGFTSLLQTFPLLAAKLKERVEK